MSLSAFSRQFLLLLFAAAILWQRAGAGTETEEQSVVVVLRDFLQTGAPDAVLLALLDGAFKVEVLEHEELVEGVNSLNCITVDKAPPPITSRPRPASGPV